MSPNKKVLFTVLTFVLAMVVIACSCSSLIPTITNQLQSITPPANVLPSNQLPNNQEDHARPCRHVARPGNE